MKIKYIQFAATNKYKNQTEDFEIYLRKLGKKTKIEDRIDELEDLVRLLFSELGKVRGTDFNIVRLIDILKDYEKLEVELINK